MKTSARPGQHSYSDGFPTYTVGTSLSVESRLGSQCHAEEDSMPESGPLWFRGIFKSQVLYSDKAILWMARVISAYAILRLNGSINIFL